MGAEPDTDPRLRRFRCPRTSALARGRARTHPVQELRLRVRKHVHPHPGCNGGRHCAGGANMAQLAHYLVLSGVLFSIGTLGVFLRRNVITMLLSIEVMLNAVNLTFLAFGHFLGSPDGQIIVFFVITVAAAEAAVGLAIVIALFRHTESLNPDAFRELKG